MKLLKPTVLCLALASVILGADAKRARRDIMTVNQPDGTSLQIKKVGDEFIHFITDVDGSILYRDEDGFYTYGNIDDTGAVVSTGIRPGSGAKDSNPIVNIKDVDIPALVEKRDVARRIATTLTADPRTSTRRHAAPQSGIGLSSTTYPRTGSPKGLIILVQYSDVKFTLSNPASYFKEMINGTNFTQYGGTGSALAYFTEQSGEKFKPSFDVYGPVTLPNNRKYYGGNDRWGDDQNPHLMVTHAIDILDKDVDFSQYDTDGDGLIDNVYVFYAGQGEASYGSEDTVWPHSWDVREAGVKKKVDGVTVAHYACSNEWEYNRPDGVGTFVHEFSHVMGLPDLYHTTQQVYYTPSEYSVLDYGPYNNDGRTPPNYSAYEKNAMGWYEPIMMDSPMSVTLDPISTGQFGLIPTSKNTEFFLLENRQLEGWDAYIPNHGMLIWHIDYVASVFENNVVNNTKNHQYVDIVEANNNPDGSNATTMKGWTFPGTTGKKEFTSTTVPALKDWNGKAIDLPVTEITESGGLISFKVAGGVALASPAPYVDGLANQGYFIASWDPIDGATDYLLTVFVESLDNGTNELTCGFDSSTIPAGWSASISAISSFYTTLGNFGAVSPSYKFSKNDQTLTSPEIDGEVTKISFWVKGQSVEGGTCLTIEGLIDSKWVTLAECFPENNKVTQPSFANLPKGIKRVKFTMKKSSGNIAIDDIVVKYGPSDEVLPDYNNVSTGGQTSMRVDKLKEGAQKYYFTVQATNGQLLSAVSDPVHVTVSGSSGIDDIYGDSDQAPVEYFNMQGIRVVRPTAGDILIRRQGNNVSKVIIR